MSSLPTTPREWLESFNRQTGRRLRVLHLGNVANNAYYVARLLNRLGVHADVLAYSNYHMMSSPEWEEADFKGVPRDHYFPDWWSMGLGNYDRPRWFAQGPWDLCIEYLHARARGADRHAAELWRGLDEARRAAHAYRRLYLVGRRVRQVMPVGPFSRIRQLLQPLVEKRVRHATNAPSEGDSSPFALTKQADRMIEEFARRFPERTDQLSVGDMKHHLDRAAALRPLFDQYDIVHAYGADAIYPCLAGSKPFVAMEHGTLRHSPEVSWEFKGPFYPNALGRLTSLAYAMADHVLITNADNIASAERLGLRSYSSLGHPIDEEALAQGSSGASELRASIGSRWIFLCPIRHDWAEKRVDLYIRALPELRREIGSDFKVLFMPWGQEISRSRKLIRQLGCEDLAAWIGPFGQVWFARWISVADVVFDQLAFSSFSGTTPRALACGIPVIVRYEHETMKDSFSEPPPVLSADSVESVVRETVRALDPEFRRNYRERATTWYTAHHSSHIVVDEILRRYARLLDPVVAFQDSISR